MKIHVTYEQADIEKLIRLDLTRQGIDAAGATVVVAGNEARATIEGVVVDEPPTAAPAPTTAPPRPAAAPSLVAIDGGSAEVDMDAVLSASEKVMHAKVPLYPGEHPGGRQMMDGESEEFPVR